MAKDNPKAIAPLILVRHFLKLWVTVICYHESWETISTPAGETTIKPIRQRLPRTRPSGFI